MNTFIPTPEQGELLQQLTRACQAMIEADGVKDLARRDRNRLIRLLREGGVTLERLAAFTDLSASGVRLAALEEN